MDIMSVLYLLGGLGLFLYGMTLMSNALERVAGAKLERTLEKMTGNLFTALLMGIVVTAVIQSSSATTVMVVGFVNAGIMSLRQSVGVILGANIGTTITAQILRLDSSGTISDSILTQLIKPKNLSYLLVFIGVLLILTAKSKKRRNVGEIFVGFGVLFIGMATMESAVSPLADSPAFAEAFATVSNPFVGVLVGALVTAVIQSSSASVGILQALSTTGIITFAGAIPIILGQNIGTCITAFLSSLGGSKNARRTAMIHFYFNMIGSLAFLAIVYGIQYTIGFDFWNDVIDKTDIANFHTLFNVTVTVLFLPFTGLLVKLAELTIAADDPQDNPLAKLEPRFLPTPALALEQAQKCIVDMSTAAMSNYELATAPILLDAKLKNDLFTEQEAFLDRAEVEISRYLVQIRGEMPMNMRRMHMEMLHSLSDFEKIGDYSQNIFDTVETMRANNLQFSDAALAEIRAMCAAVSELMSRTVSGYTERSASIAREVEPIEEVVDVMKSFLREQHVDRLNNEACSIETGFPFLEIVHDLEKIGDHCSNIAIYTIQLREGDAGFNTHSWDKAAIKETAAFQEQYQLCWDKYMKPLMQNV